MKKNQQGNRLQQPVPDAQIGMHKQAQDEETQLMPVVSQAPQPQPLVQPQAQAQGQTVDKAVIQLRAEELVPTKEWIETGAVLVRKGVEVYPQTIPVDLLHEEVSVERVPINRVLAEGEVAAPWQDGDVMVIPVVHEELVVMKRLVVREELRVSKVRVPARQNITDNVRRETISFETTGNVRMLPGQNDNPQGRP